MKTRLSTFFPAVLFCVAGLVTGTLRAAPYASGLVNTAGTISFLLNEPADNVTVKFDNGAATTDLGARPAGPQSFPLGAHTSFQIIVEKNAGPGWKAGVLQQLSNDADILTHFTNQRGVAVNKNPGSPYFGRVYISVGSAGSIVEENGAPARSVSDGIYILNPDLTATALGSEALTGGLPNLGASTESPFRVTVGPDDQLYIADWSDVTGSLYVADPNMTAAVNMLPGPAGAPAPPLGDLRFHGSISAVVVEGSLATNNLNVFVVDEDLQDDRNSASLNQLNSIWKWPVGGGPLPVAEDVAPERFNTSGITFASQRADLVRDAGGFFYKAQRRAAGQTQAGIFVIDPSGTLIADSKTAWLAFKAEADPPVTLDVFQETGGIDISSDGWLAAIFYTSNAIQVVKIVTDADPISPTFGMPSFDFSRFFDIPTAPATLIGRDIAFDAAGNIYTVSSGQHLLRVYAPGGHTVATTSSNGQFTIDTPPVPATPPQVGNVTLAANTLTIQFTSTTGTPAAFQLEKSSTGATGSWSPDAGAVFTGTAPTFTVTTTVSALDQFYRLRRL